MGKIVMPFGPPQWDEENHKDSSIEFQKRVAEVVNSLGYDNLFGIPDFILAQALRQYLYILPSMFGSLAQMMTVEKEGCGGCGDGGMGGGGGGEGGSVR